MTRIIARSWRRSLVGMLAAGMAASIAGAAAAEELTLSYFMGPRHPMNRAVFTPFAEKLAEVSGRDLSLGGGRVYRAAAERGITTAQENGVEVIALSDAEIERFNASMQPAMDAFLASEPGDGLTGAEVLAAMRGE